ncbi:cystatin-M [Rana temporaria]|uniref:cystatin-M n=1 Tax=Rana temporaria TaxID=8407 RepID=UPI001AACCA46|nr:cystatin-M [Rana temporaria]
MASQAVMSAVLCALLSLGWAALLGGWSAADTNSEELKDIAEFSVSQYNLQSNGDSVYTMVSLKDAKQQVVSGMNYKLTLVLGKTACKKSKGYINKPCPLLTGSKLKKLECVFVVYDIPWQSKRTLTGKRCTKI